MFTVRSEAEISAARAAWEQRMQAEAEADTNPEFYLRIRHQAQISAARAAWEQQMQGETDPEWVRIRHQEWVRIRQQETIERMHLTHPAGPASDLARAALPWVVVTSEDMDATSATCCICMEDHKAGTRATRMLCGHLFCTGCIQDWLRTANSCPVCRYELPTDSQEFERGRQLRMEGRRARLKMGELLRMRVPELKLLVGALGISEAGCVEPRDFISNIENARGVEVLREQKRVLYEENYLKSLDLPLLRELGERHGLFVRLDVGGDEELERSEILHRFIWHGWVRGRGARLFSQPPGFFKLPAIALPDREVPSEYQRGPSPQSSDDPREAPADPQRRRPPWENESGPFLGGCNPVVHGLVGLGVPSLHAEAAARRCSSVEAAVDWLAANGYI